MIRTITITCILCLLCSSCDTYRTFYGETARSLDVNEHTRRLDVSYQKLERFSVAYDTLKALRMINLSGNTKLDIATILASLPQPEKLEVLVLDSLGLKEIPKEVQRFKNLKQLSLAYNPSLDLEKTIFSIELLPLEFLNLKGNQLTQLPETITHLKTLKDLNLSYNALHDADSYTYLGAMPNLYSLWLDHNDLTQLPVTIGTIDQVTYFYIDHNALTSLPNEISGMKNVWTIHAGHNLFTALPEQLIDMPVLKLAHMNNNQIVSIPRKYETAKYSMLALLLDHNPLPEKERIWAEKVFRKFFLLSFKQSY